MDNGKAAAQRCAQGFSQRGGNVAEFVVTDGTRLCVGERTSDRTLHHPLQSR